MGYMFIVGNCFGCGKIFIFNADRVPSITWKGTRRPICQDCVNKVNPLREANGLEPIQVLKDAYESQEVE